MLSSRPQFDVLVVGGGPAGIAAAVSAAQSGKRVAIADDNPALGGQIWRGETIHSDPSARAWSSQLRESSVELFPGARIFDQPAPGVLNAETMDGSMVFEYGKLILATGARERFLPFPGWTLPNVMGAGALQALAKAGLPIQGKRVVVAGTGPLLLAVASYLNQRGAIVVAICEQASLATLGAFGLRLFEHPGKIAQAWGLHRELARVRLLTSAWPMAAVGNQILESVVMSVKGTQQRISCDYLACGFHLVPNTELAALVGCRLEGGFVQVDELQTTSVPNIFCAGEPAGIGGVDLALVEGQIAGLAASGHGAAAEKLRRQRAKLQSFARSLEKTFQLRPELKRLAAPETIVCRCEDVTLSQLQPHGSWRAAKLQSRCGMGPCQGRICGPATQFLLGWTPDSVRPPVLPVKLRNLTSESHQPKGELTSVM
ncbi:MAG TPA: FAD/NAD(P)-binding oxidoreductase [Terriglobales bacterium]|jgi:NADPH-dependent 2,4-dienoyl-CoA reductase/sulfur reductase-like enzyme|nr:FAD/NAD(P)-binding oxidoreductase [Terriglobales bacterium]